MRGVSCNPVFPNIPILPVGILDFCKQKLLAPPMKPMNHLKSVDFFSNLNRNKENKNKEKTKQ